MYYCQLKITIALYSDSSALHLRFNTSFDEICDSVLLKLSLIQKVKLSNSDKVWLFLFLCCDTPT